MRVMQVLHQGGGSGSVTSTLHLSLGLAKAGVEIVFVCPPDSEVEALARASNLLDVVPAPLAAHRRRANARALAHAIANTHVELVNSQSSRDRAALTWLGLTRRLHIPAVFTRRQMPLTFFLENWVASRIATRVVAVSETVGEALVRKGTPRSRLRVIHNGLVTARIDRPVTASELDRWKERSHWETSRRVVGIVSRPKDQAVVLRALEHVVTPVRLVLAGVEEKGELAELASKVPERHAVVFIPFSPDIIALYHLLDLALLPTRMEGLSQSLLEAMALGKPVIASAVAGNLDVVTLGQDGILVPPLDARAWATAIDQVLGDAALAARLGAAARVTARERFSLDQTVTRTLSLYREILNR
jgi:glycosyltransferase involved in cell wall biosynthesis